MRKTLFFGGIMALALVAGTARAELKVTLTIDGDVTEMIAVLQQLQLLGLGVSAPEEEDPLKMRLESVYGQEEAENETAPASAPEPVLALTRPVATPKKTSPGGTLVLSVAVIDERRAVDTLSATVIGTGLAFDLFDNGTHGDETPADGVWTASFVIPPDTPVGEYEVNFIAYDGAGNPLTAPTPEGSRSAVTVSTKVTIAAPKAPEPPVGPKKKPKPVPAPNNNK